MKYTDATMLNGKRLGSVPDSPEKSPKHQCDFSSDSDFDHNSEKKLTRADQILLKWLKDNLLLMVTLAGVVLGTAAGFILRPLGLSEDTILLISYPGELFMRVLKLIILPLVVSSLISCSAGLNARLNGRIAFRTISYFVLTSFFNACLGITLALLIQPGSRLVRDGFTDSPTSSRTVNVLDSFLDIGRNMVPDNIFQAFFQQTHTVYTTKIPFNASGLDEVALEGNFSAHLVRTLKHRDGTNNIGIISFSLLFGTVLGTLQNPNSRLVIDFFRIIYEVVMKIMTGVMWLTPVGICSVICGKILSVEDIFSILGQLGWFIITVVIGVIFYQLVVLQLIYFAVLRRNPFTFYWGLTPGMLTAFATASTAAALPVTFQCMDEKLRVDQRISRFILPIGCSLNMDGTALFLSSATIFIAQMNSMSLELGDLATVCLVSTAASMSSASVPSAALVLMLMVLTSIGCPADDVSLLFAVDWLVDRCRTMNNMLGDCYAAAVVQHLSRAELSDESEVLPLHNKDVSSPQPSLNVSVKAPTVVVDIPNGFS